jgi:DNA-binding MarR family transcriptional regulator
MKMANYYKEINKMIERLVHRVLIYDRTGFKSGMKAETLSLLDVYILKKIGEVESKKIYELVHEMEMDRGIVASSTNKLVSCGFVEKQKSQEDKRVFILRLTEEGRHLWEKNQGVHAELLNVVLGDVTLNEEKAILKFLSKMNQRTLLRNENEKNLSQ